MKRFEGAAILSSQERYPDSSGPTMLENGLIAARDALLSLQKDDGHWCFPLERIHIPAEYVLMMHFMDDVDAELEIRLARFIREKQDLEHGGWPLYYGGAFDLSCTVKAVLCATRSWVTPRTRLTCDGPAQPFSNTEGPRVQTYLLAYCLRCTGRFPGAAFHLCLWKSFCCRSGSRFTSARSRIGLAP